MDISIRPAAQAAATVEDPEFPNGTADDPVVGPSKPRLLGILGPGLITGASDDDPSGVATYSQAGAQLGFSCLWLMPFTYPLMAVTQEISARIGRTTGQGMAGNIRRHYPAWVGHVCIALLLAANIVNLGADLGSMGDVTAMLAGGPRWLFVLAFGGLCVTLQVFLSYARYTSLLKWLTLALFAYFGTALVVKIPWGEALHGLVVPTWSASRDYVSVIVAVLGTTISPYLFFWQSSQEAEDQREQPLREKLTRAPEQAPAAFARIRLDTWIGMALSNLVALAILLTTAATLHASGKTDITTAQQAAEALKPVAGGLAYAVFALGILGSGFMAVPVLAGSAAYAIGEALRWPVGLARKPKEARAFYATLVIATVLGTILNFLPVDPIKALFWSAVINGVMAAPIILVMMLLASNRRVMGRFTLSPGLRIIGWSTAAVMGAAVAGLFATL
ncbi:MAG TPA: Nramp family divalent metal transporter [Acetobacteraceae bacterium]|nr:Nramp family divalent metal transporter [Acetobacteraceae bacterium]